MTVDIGLAVFAAMSGHHDSSLQGMCLDPAENIERAHPNSWAHNVRAHKKVCRIFARCTGVYCFVLLWLLA